MTRQTRPQGLTMPDWIDGPEYDRWKTDPEYVHPDDLERVMAQRMEEEAAKAWDDYYTPHVIADFEFCQFKPGRTVRWLDKDNNRMEGVVAGATAVDAVDELNFIVVVVKGREVTIHQVDEISLMYGWEVLEPEPEPTPEPSSPPPYSDDDIPF